MYLLFGSSDKSFVKITDPINVRIADMNIVSGVPKHQELTMSNTATSTNICTWWRV